VTIGRSLQDHSASQVHDWCAGDVAQLERVVDQLPALTCGALRKPVDID
jgi:hypothetical protein